METIPIVLLELRRKCLGNDSNVCKKKLVLLCNVLISVGGCDQI